MTIVYSYICSNRTNDFYIAKIAGFWYTFCVKRGAKPSLDNSFYTAGFMQKETAIDEVKQASVWYTT